MQAVIRPMSCSKLEEKMISQNGYWWVIGRTKEGQRKDANGPGNALTRQ